MSIPRRLSLSRFLIQARDDRAQDAFEYMLAAGVVVVVIAGALFAFNQVVPLVVGNGCESVDTAASPAPSDGSCVTQGP